MDKVRLVYVLAQVVKAQATAMEVKVVGVGRQEGRGKSGASARAQWSGWCGGVMW